MGTRTTQVEKVQNEKVEWATVGCRLAQAELEEHAEATSLALRQAAQGARDGDLTADELQRCYQALTDVELLLDEFADAIGGFDRPPRLEEELSQDQIVEALGD